MKDFRFFKMSGAGTALTALILLVSGCAENSADSISYSSRPHPVPARAQSETPEPVVEDAAAAALETPSATPVLVQSLPVDQVVPFKERFTLSVQLKLPPDETNNFPVWYQWQRNGTNFGGSTTNYSLIGLFENQGTYSVTASSAWGKFSTSWNISTSYDGSYIDENTLAYHLATNAVGRAKGFEGTGAEMRFLKGFTSATYTPENLHMLTNATWSTDFWLADVNGLSATAIGIQNNLGGRMLLTMVSPRHYLRSTHISKPRGPVAFLDTNNIIHWRNAVQQMNVGNDVSVGLLDADLPPSVGFVPVLPVNYTNHLPLGAKYIQGFGMNQSRRVFGQTLWFSANDVHWNTNTVSPFGLGIDWQVPVIGGDSSLPEYVLIGDQLVMVSMHRSRNLGPNIAFYTDEINRRMHMLSTNNNVRTDYQLTPFPLESWPRIN